MTTLVRWSPFRDFDVVERQMRRVFDDLGFARAPLPATDVYETDREYVFEVEAPGFDEKELTVEVIDHTLTVKGEQAEELERQDRTFRLHERLEKTFERRFELPRETETEKIAAEFTNGVLTVHAPKAKTVEPLKVEIAPKA